MINFKVLYGVLWILWSVWSLTAAASSSKTERSKLPSFVKICHRNDPQLNKCARNALYALKDRLVYGIPELFIPALEPLIIPEIKMNQNTGAVYLKSTYKNIHLYGASNFTIKSLHIEPVKMKLTSTMMFSNVTINADYQIDGKIMMMPLTGSGKCNANFTDVSLTTVMFGERQKKNGQTYLKMKKIQVNYEVGKVKLNLNDLFNGDNALGDRMNSFLNDNWDSLSEELRPLLEKALTGVVKSTTDKLFAAYSYDDLLPE